MLGAGHATDHDHEWRQQLRGVDGVMRAVRGEDGTSHACVWCLVLSMRGRARSLLQLADSWCAAFVEQRYQFLLAATVKGAGGHGQGGSAGAKN